MATYTYTTEWFDGSVSKCGEGYIDYNITPASGQIGPGTRITFSGRVRGNTKAIKSIGVVLAGKDGDRGHDIGYVMLGYINKSIAKATTTTFTLTVTVSMAQWEMERASYGPLYNSTPLTPEFIVGTKPMTSAQVNNADWADSATGDELAGYTETVYSGSLAAPYTMSLEAATAPVISGTPAVTDEASVSALTVLGNIVTVNSHPRVSGAWAYDSHYPDQLGHVALVLTGAMEGTYEADTGSGVTAASFDLPTPTQAGTVNWSYTVTDMFGNVATATGNFEVLSYVKPYITSCAFERYQEVQTDTGFEHEASPSGEYIWLNLDANIAAVDSRNAWTATLTAWRKERPEIAPTAGSAVYENTTGERRTVSTWALAGSDGQHIQLARDEDNLSDEMVLSAAFDWCLRLTLTDALGNSVTLLVDDDIRKDSAILDVGPYGVSVGARSTALAADPLFECSYPAQFKGDVAVPAGGLLKVVSTQLWADQSVASGGYLIDTYTVSAGDGWTPLGIVGYNINSHWIYVYDLRLQSATTVRCGVHNARSSAQTCSMTIRLLCVRTSL